MLLSRSSFGHIEKVRICVYEESGASDRPVVIALSHDWSGIDKHLYRSGE